MKPRNGAAIKRRRHINGVSQKKEPTISDEFPLTALLIFQGRALVLLRHRQETTTNTGTEATLIAHTTD